MPRRAALLGALFVVAALWSAAPAMASSVINPTVSMSSTAGGIKHVQWVVKFKATSMVINGGFIKIEAPNGTVLPTFGDVHNDTTGAAFSRSGTRTNFNATLQINLCCTDAINPNDDITVTLDDVTNPASGGSNQVNVSTSTDTTPAPTPSFSLTTPEQITGLSNVALSSSATNAQHVSYSFQFNASGTTGRLVDPGTITIAAPNGTVLPTFAEIHDITSGQTFSRSGTRTNGNATLEVQICCSDVINPGDTVEITLDDVKNPNVTGAQTLSVATSSNPVAVTSPSYNLTPTEPITGVSGVSLSSTASGVQHVTYSFSFATSTGNGKLVSPGTIKIDAPAGTVLPTFAEIHDVTSGQTFSRSGARTNSNATLELSICCSDVINPGDTVEITLDDVKNTTTSGALHLNVSTSSNPTPVATTSYSVTSPEQITGLTGVSMSSTAGGIQHVTYSLSFTASGNSGRLVPTGTIKIAAPPGTVLPTFGEIRDNTSGQTFTRSGTRTNSNSTLELTLCCSDVVNPGDSVTITLDDVQSAAPGGPYTFDVSTSSNPTPVTTPGYSLSAPQSVTGVTAVTTSTDAHGVVSDSFSFKPSSTGGLVPSGTIKITGPAGTVMPTVAEVKDLTTAQTFTRSATRSNSNQTVEIELCCIDALNPGDTVMVTLPEIVNPAGGAGPFVVSTSSDTVEVTTPPFTPPGPPPPVIGKKATAAVEKGLVRVKLPGKKGFVTLTQATSVPIGSILDTTKGQVGLTFATNASGATQRGSFSQGQFQVQQSKKNPLTTMSMVGAGLNSCKTKLPKGGAKKPEIATTARKRRRTLFSSVKGRFRTRGRNSTATVRGTKWRVTDTCSGTKTTVTQGSVVVRDLTLRRNVLVKAGHSYLARAPLRKKKKH